MSKDPMSIEEAREILEKCKWEHPAHYGGFSPDGDYLIYSINGGSCLLEEVNFKEIKNALDAVEKTLPAREEDRVISGFGRDERVGSWAYDWRASHWAVSWVDYLMVSSDSPDEMIIEAARIIKKLDGYPVFNDDAYGEARHEEVWKDWSENLDLRERVDLCREVGVSIFAARRVNDIPDACYDRLSEQ